MAAPSAGFWQRRGVLGLYELLLTWWRHRVSFVISVFITFFALALYYFTFVGERTTPIFNFIQRLEYDSLDTRFRYRPRSATPLDPRIEGRGAARAVAKTRIQRVVFQALYKIKNRGGAFADEREVVQRQRKKGDEHAGDEGNAVAPPCQKQFVEAECAPPLPETR